MGRMTRNPLKNPDNIQDGLDSIKADDGGKNIRLFWKEKKGRRYFFFLVTKQNRINVFSLKLMGEVKIGL
jgi:hypothetical protein